MKKQKLKPAVFKLSGEAKEFVFILENRGRRRKFKKIVAIPFSGEEYRGLW